MVPITTEKPFDIGIVGGGIAGLTLTIALLKRGIKPTLYEAAPHFGEIGAGVGFEPHFVQVMESIAPEIKEAFMNVAQSSAAARTKWFDVRIEDQRKADNEGTVFTKGGSKVKLGDIIFTIPSTPGPKGGVHRAHFLDELVKLVPDGIAKFRKRVVDITPAEDGSGDAVLHFADGSTARHTAVVGCDGIKSRTREVVLGKEEARPVFSGKYVYRGLLPMEKAVEIMGEGLPMQPQMHCGHKGHVLTFPIAKGTLLNVVAFNSKDEWTDPEWVVKTSKGEMLSDYAGWSSKVQDIIANMKSPDIWALFNHQPARTYFQLEPRICLLGDAAHASTPHQGAGAGMCIEDCYILGSLLANAETKKEIENAFKAYDKVRRPRSLKLVETSRQAGMLWELEGPEGDDYEAMEQNAVTRMKWIWNHDMAVDLNHAQMHFKQLA